MSILVDLLFVGLLIYAIYAGTQRGMVLLGLELASFVMASAVALWLYHPLGAGLKGLAGLTLPLSNVTAFVSLWVVTEIVCAVLIRVFLLKHLTRDIQLSPVNRIGGAVLGIMKTTIIIVLGLMVFTGLPLSAATKQTVANSHIGKFLLASSNHLQSGLASGLGRDLGESLNFFTVTAEPESQEHIDLGYTTSGPVSPALEDAMLVLINRERTSRGLGALTMNVKARAVGREYSKDMFARGYFSHISLEGKNPFDRMRDGDVSFNAAGENLALAPTLELAHSGLMNSPGHRANILSTSYRTVGIGIIDGGAYGIMVTQDFTD